MKNTIQLYIDDEKKIKGYPVTSPDRVVDENGKSVQQEIKKINDRLDDIVGEGGEIKKQMNDISEQLDNIGKKSLLSITDFGAIGDNITDDTEAIKNGINKARELQATLYFPRGTYKCRKIDIIGLSNIKGDDLNFELRGESSKNTIINCIDDDYLFNFEGQYTTRRCQMRNCVITDLKIVSDNLDNIAFKFNICQHFHINNVWIQGFKNGALNFKDTFDFQYNNLDIYQCGKAENVDNYAYAITFNANVDNCNAHKFINTRLEYCPLFIRAIGNNKHNFFTNCKFEKGSIANNSSKSPFHFTDIREISFNQCFFVYASKSTTNPIDNGTYFIFNEYLNTSLSVQYIKFSNCNFACSGDARCNWYKGSSTSYINCDFYGSICNSTNHTPFYLNSNNIMDNCKFLLNDDVRLIRINGNNNKLNVILSVNVDNTTLSTFTFDDNSRYNIIHYSLNKNNLNRDFISASSTFINGGCIYLGTNIVKELDNRVLTSTSYIPRVNSDYIRQDTNKITGINYSYEGQIITVYCNQNCTLVHSDYFKTLTSEDVIIKAGTICKFISINNKIRQI